MADKKISQLTAVTVPSLSDQFEVNQSGVSKRLTAAQLFTLISVSPASEATVGVSRYATQAEVNAGVVSDATVRPNTLAQRVLTGGDLGGTIATPTVTAIRETSGPTSLVIGSIPNTSIPFRSGSTFVGSALTQTATAIVSTLSLLAGVGSAALPAWSFGAEPGLGVRRTGAGVMATVQGGFDYWSFAAATISAPAPAAINAATNNTITLGGNTTSGTSPLFRFGNSGVFAGGAAAAQQGLSLAYGANQTSTASFNALQIDLGLAAAGTGTPVFGSVGGFFVDFRTNSVSQFKVSAAGATLVGVGSVSAPPMSFLAEPGLGFRRSNTQQIAVVSGGVDTWVYSNNIFQAPNTATIGAGFNSLLNFDANTTTGTGGFTFTSGASYTGASVVQRGIELRYGVNQTGTSDFTALKINLGLVAAGTGTPVFGSAGGFFAKFQTNSVTVASITADGRMQIAIPTANNDAATKGYVDQVSSNVQAAGYAFQASDIGGVVSATGAGAQAFTLPTLASALIAGKMMLLTVQQEGAATNVTITPGGTSTIDGAAVGVAFVIPAGRKRVSLFSRNGLNWFSGN